MPHKNRCSPLKRWSEDHAWLSATLLLSQKKPHLISPRDFGVLCLVGRLSLHVLRLPRPLYFAVFVKFIAHAFKAIFETVNLHTGCHSLFIVQLLSINIIYLFTTPEEASVYNLIPFLRVSLNYELNYGRTFPLFFTFFLLIIGHFG